jgi:hypothetical protein
MNADLAGRTGAARTQPAYPCGAAAGIYAAPALKAAQCGTSAERYGGLEPLCIALTDGGRGSPAA